jgi:ribosomal protein S18 acetylase RimI-like enzyme
VLTEAIPASATLRLAADGDGEFQRRLFATTRQHEMNLLPWNEEQVTALLDMQHDAQNRSYRHQFPGARVDIVEVDGVPAGRLVRDTSPTDVHIIDIALLPQYRGSGLGRSLIEEIIEGCRATGRQLSIHVALGNPARRLYERLGFVAMDQHGLHTLMAWSPSEPAGS